MPTTISTPPSTLQDERHFNPSTAAEPSCAEPGKANCPLNSPSADDERSASIAAARLLAEREIQPTELKPVISERRTKCAKYPFGNLEVGQSVVFRGVNGDNLDHVITLLRKRKDVDLGRVRIFGDWIDGCRVFRRS